MSSVGYPDYQRITQWLGAPLVQGTGVAVFPGPHVDGPLEAANFASIIVAVKAIGGNVTVTLRQTVPGGPASLELVETIIVPAGSTLFEAFVLFGAAVELDLTGSIAGTTVDYALYPSNTTTNAQVITNATINVQKNGVLIAAEPTLDFVDGLVGAWTITDDGPGTRVLITPPAPTWVKLSDTILGAPAASVDITGIPQTYAALKAIIQGRSTVAAVYEPLRCRFNNDTGNNYDAGVMENGGDLQTAAIAYAHMGDFTGGTAPAGVASAVEATIPNYAAAVFQKSMLVAGGMKRGLTAIDPFAVAAQSWWRNAAAINRLTFSPFSGNFDTGTRVTLYGIA